MKRRFGWMVLPSQASKSFYTLNYASGTGLLGDASIRPDVIADGVTSTSTMAGAYAAGPKTSSGRPEALTVMGTIDTLAGKYLVLPGAAVIGSLLVLVQYLPCTPRVCFHGIKAERFVSYNLA